MEEEVEMFNAAELQRALPDPHDQFLFRLAYNNLADMSKELTEYDRALTRLLLVKLIQQKPNHRPADPNLPNKQAHVFLTMTWLTEVENWPKEAAKLECATLYSISRSSVESHVAEFRKALDSNESAKKYQYQVLLARGVLDRIYLCAKGIPTEPSFDAIKHHCMEFGPEYFRNPHGA